MAQDPKIGQLIDAMVASGASDEEIAQAVEKHKAASADPRGFMSGVGAEIKDQAVGVKDLLVSAGKAIAQQPMKALNPGALAADLARESSQARLAGGPVGASEFDPTGVSQIVGSDEPTMMKAGRGTVLAAETLLPFLWGGKAAAGAKLAKGAKAPRPGSLAVRTGTDPLMSLAEGPIKPAPGPKFTLTGGRSVTPTGTSSAAGGMRMTVPASQRPNQFTLSVVERGKASEALGGSGTAEAALTPEVSPANAAAKAEAAGEAAALGRTEPPGRAPVYGGVERRSPSRVSGAAEDKAYREVRKRLEEKAAMERAKAQLTGKREAPKPKEEAPAAAEVSPDDKPLLSESDVRRFETQASVEKEGTGGIHNRNPQPKEVGADKGALAGFTRQPTKTLKQMVEEYGKEGAATRAGMSVEELEVRLAAGNDPAKLAKGMRDKFGSEKAARLLGMKRAEVVEASGGGPSRLPEKAVKQIEAAAAKERAATGSVSEKTQKLLDRIEKERMGGETGAQKVGPMLATAGAVGGGVAGSLMPAKDAEQRTNNIIGAGMSGLLLGAAPHLRLGKSLKVANALRREAFLTGGAIPKNLMTAAGAAVRAGVENTASKERLAPAKEMLRVPTNAKSFWKHFKEDPIPTEYGSPVLGKAAKYMPSKVIGAIDDTARDALKRAGVSQEQIDRYLLTADRNLFGPSAKLTPAGKEVANVLVPFQRVPMNVLIEGINELGHLPKADLRALMTAAQMYSGYEVGKWAKGDKKRQYLASIALALAGPATAPVTAAAAYGAGLRGFAAGSLGGISPVPEQAFDPKSLMGIKPAFVSGYQRLTEK